MKKVRLVCDVVCFNHEKIEQFRSNLSSIERLQEDAARFKVLGHAVRLAILEVLDAEEACVCDLANILNEPVSTVSQHLKLLRQSGFLTSRQEGKLVFYRRTEPDFAGLPVIYLKARQA